MRYLLTATAVADIEELHRYVAKDNPRAATRLLDRLLRSCRQLADHPNLGRRRTELGAEVRSWPVGNYVLYYRQANERIEVLRVLHGARDRPVDRDDATAD